MFSRAFHIVFLIVFAACLAFAASATLELRVRDIRTDHPIRATIKLDGPESLKLQTNEAGRLTRTMLPGEYRAEVSAPRYKALRTRFTIGTSGVMSSTS
jgi:hypothetical protein